MVSYSLLNHVDHRILHTGKALYTMFWYVNKLGMSGTGLYFGLMRCFYSYFSVA